MALRSDALGRRRVLVRHRVDYRPEDPPIPVDALAEQFAFRTDRWRDPFDMFFDRGIFYLNETEWTQREFQCAFLPKSECYHLRDGSSLSSNREQDLGWMNEATRYYARKTYGVDLRGVRWNAKFWLDLRGAKAVRASLVRNRDDLPPAAVNDWELPTLLEQAGYAPGSAFWIAGVELHENFLILSCDACASPILVGARIRG